jgi:hypothetical protein
MPRLTSPNPYFPSPSPYVENQEVLTRAVWDEFFRIQQALIDIDRPTAISAVCKEPVTVEATQNWDRMFDEAVSYDWQLPSGTLNTTTGVWTCPQEGLYQISATVEAPPFPSPATKEYTVSIRLTKHPVDGSPDVVIIAQDSGIDTQAVRVSAGGLRPLATGDQLWMDADLTHQTKTGTVLCTGVLNILRVGSVR